MRFSSSARPKDPFTAALDALRSELRGGRLIMGEPLTITELAQDLGLSATPVREALSRLAGEGLIEDRRGRGYFARRVDVADLVELYGMRAIYLAAAVDRSRADLEPFRREGAGEAAGPARPMDAIFDRLIAEAGDRTLSEAYRALEERLGPASAVEAAVFEASEEAAWRTAIVSEKPEVQRQALADYHRARQVRAGEIVRAMRARANIASL